MANVGNITAAAISARNENSLSLANLNFDFSLVKLQAPKEFQQLGDALTSWRRQNAETGSAHRTARKLGALFDQLANPGEELVKAYGQRVSQISASESLSPKGPRKDSMFAKHAGADGTAIWAAATSGKTAIAVLLLACMLARMWDPPKSISIWYELVEKRKQQIAQLYDGSEPSHLAPMAAAQQDIARKELAEWDASARAWLAIADQVKEKEHRRMESILLTLSLPVDNSSDVFRSVVRAWTNAMTTMENIIKGMPQRIHNGAVLLAISAWHLYPDVDLFGRTAKCLAIRDSLVRSGGRLTVGLEDAEPGSGGGVYWSLSLANLRYYGDPVLETRHVKDESRVAFDEIILVSLGSIFRSWEGKDFDANFDQEAGAKFFINLWEFIKPAVVSGYDTPTRTGASSARSVTAASKTWFEHLAIAARTLLEGDEQKRKRARGLVSLGARRGLSFLQPESQPIASFFGLCDPHELVKLFPDRQGQVDTLRQMSAILSLDTRFPKTILRYEEPSTHRIEYATAFPVPERTKRDRSDVKRPSKYHVRWIGSPVRWGVKCDCTRGCDVSDCRCRLAGVVCSSGCAKTLGEQGHVGCKNTRRAAIEALGETYQPLDSENIQFDANENRLDWYQPFQDGGAPSQSDNGDGPVGTNMFDWEQRIVELDKWNSQRTDQYRLLLGDPKNGAIFVCTRSAGVGGDAPHETTLEISSSVTVEMLTNLLDSRKLDVGKVVQHLAMRLGPIHPTASSHVHNTSTSPRRISSAPAEDVEGRPSHMPTTHPAVANHLTRSMQGLAAAGQVYSRLPGATVSLGIIEKKLWAASWLPPVGPNVLNPLLELGSFLEPQKLNLSHTLSCVTMFDTGKLDIPPKELENVFAMSTGNSIYAAVGLLADPYEICEDYELRRILGNVGRPGVSMLIPPANPIIRNAGFENWQLVNHARFHASTQCGDYFDNTSLHLSFTGYELPVAAAVQHGAQDTEASYLEALVSVFDGSKKVADIDVRKALISPRVIRMRSHSGCDHGGEKMRDSAFTWISIDSWIELAELPDRKTSIVRAHGNSLSRIAALAVCVQMGVEGCFVAAPDVCYACVAKWWAGSGRLQSGRQIIIC